MPSRRDLIKGGLVGLGALVLPGLAGATRKAAPDWLWSAADDDTGGHHLLGYAPATGERRQLNVPERCHGGCRRPGHAQAVLFARRPGRAFYVVDTVTGELVSRVAAGDDHHFYGHGVFAPDERLLYATANRIDDGAGLVRIFDAERGYALLGEIDLDGIGPHELRLMPDGETLAVALGGIRTHPDYGRAKLNLHSMAPALLLVDRHTGTIRERHPPSHPQLSCRHLDVGADGTVIAGYQFQGPAWERHPLLARRGPDGTFSELSLPEALTDELRHYTASIAMAANAPRCLVTAPRGHRALLLDSRDGRLLASHALDDAAGALADPRGGFWVSSGSGGLYRLPDDGGPAQHRASLPLRWDNHLT